MRLTCGSHLSAKLWRGEELLATVAREERPRGLNGLARIRGPLVRRRGGRVGPSGERKGKWIGASPRKRNRAQEALLPNSRERVGKKINLLFFFFQPFAQVKFKKNLKTT